MDDMFEEAGSLCSCKRIDGAKRKEKGTENMQNRQDFLQGSSSGNSLARSSEPGAIRASLGSL